MAAMQRHVHIGALHVILEFAQVLLALMVTKLLAIHFNGHPLAQAYLTVV